MSLCKGQVRADMYGLGIRISSYVQWSAAIAFQRKGPRSLPEIRLLGLLLSGGITIGLLHQVCQDKLDAAAIYILLLLATGPHMFLVPVYMWRALTCFDPFWDPLRGYQEEQLRTFRVLNLALILTASSVGVWFYTTYLPALNRDCVQYGFLFGKATLHDNAPFAALNALLYLLMVLTCVMTVVAKACCRVEESRRERRRLRSRRTREHFERMRAPHTLSNLAVFAVLVAAVELPVRWNELWESNRIDTSAQVIPLLVSIGIVVRVTYLHNAEDGDEEASTVVPLAVAGGANEWALEIPQQIPTAYVARGARRI